MALRDMPMRVQRLDVLYSDRGGVATYALGKIKGGMKVSFLAREFSAALGENVPSKTLYAWLARFKADERENAGKELVRA